MLIKWSSPSTGRGNLYSCRQCQSQDMSWNSSSIWIGWVRRDMWPRLPRTENPNSNSHFNWLFIFKKAIELNLQRRWENYWRQQILQQRSPSVSHKSLKKISVVQIWLHGSNSSWRLSPSFAPTSRPVIIENHPWKAKTYGKMKFWDKLCT